MTRVIVLSRAKAREFSSDEPYVVVSITDPRAPKADLLDDRNRKGLLRLKFDDVDAPGHDLAPIAMTQAKRLWSFVKRHVDAGICLVVCHCEAGISRSAGAAAAIAKMLNGNDDAFFGRGMYCPNMLVYRSILEAASQPGTDRR